MIPTTLRRIAILFGLLAAGALADDIRDGKDGNPLTRTELLQRLAGADFLLLGETHDNPLHHRARAALLRDLPAPAGRVVLEQLDRGARLDPALPLEEALERAGFQRNAWQWPLHEPVFAAARERGMPLAGGNLSRADGRRIATQGEAAVAPALAALLAEAPLSETARRELDGDLVEGHCGRLPAARLPNMRLAQRARDAALALGLLEAGTVPALLIAGNGHVRRDYGVPVPLAARAPGAKVVSVGFVEVAAGATPDPAALRGRYDYVWFTPAVEREDPCAGLRMP